MGDNRFSLFDLDPQPAQPAFVAVPPCLSQGMDAGAFQCHLYQWAFQQAQTATTRPAPKLDLFTVLN